jgi:Protein of unknown function (DUF2695)
MKNRPTTKRNSITEASQKEKGGRAHIKRTELRRRSKTLGSAQVESATRADTIKRDLNQRKANNQKLTKLDRALERFVLALDLDWDAFHDLLLRSFNEADCNHDHTLCRHSLALMGLEDETIQACLSYFRLQGGFCDCEVVLNVDMTEPEPLVAFSCKDCASDYDEDYMVQNDVWKACGAGDGMLCIGCLEKRIGRKLRRQDFTDLPLNEINPKTRSLRLQDRLSTEPSKAAPSSQAAGCRHGYRPRAVAANSD